MSRVSTPQTRRLGQGMVYVDRQATRPWEAVESRHITSRCQPGHQAKQSCREKCPPLQGPGTAGMIVWRSQARLAIGHRGGGGVPAGLNALSPCVEGCAGGLTGCHALEEGRLSGAWPPMGHMRATRRLPAWVTAGKGPIASGTLTRTKPASARLADRADRPVVKTSHFEENA